jgi:outer membrane protein OmpA-like peptidoglycan-associated protein
MRSTTIGLICAAALIFGCAGKNNMIVLTGGDDGQAGAIQVTNAKGSVTLEAAGQATYVGGPNSKPTQPEVVSEQEMAQEFAEALAVKPMAPQKFILYFEADSPRLTPASTEDVGLVIKAINARESAEVVVIGHTDRKGDEDYNYGLSLKRAERVKELLVFQGISELRIETISYGEGNPLIPTADDVAEPKNRRVEVVVR